MYTKFLGEWKLAKMCFLFCCCFCCSTSHTACAWVWFIHHNCTYRIFCISLSLSRYLTLVSALIFHLSRLPREAFWLAAIIIQLDSNHRCCCCFRQLLSQKFSTHSVCFDLLMTVENFVFNPLCCLMRPTSGKQTQCCYRVCRPYHVGSTHISTTVATTTKVHSYIAFTDPTQLLQAQRTTCSKKAFVVAFFRELPWRENSLLTL